MGFDAHAPAVVEVAHVDIGPADRAIAEMMIGFGIGNAVRIDAAPLLHDLAFGFSLSSSHLRATSSTLSARHRDSAAS
jgi:hypothetical protein